MPYTFTIEDESECYFELAEAVLGETDENLIVTHNDTLDTARTNAALAKAFWDIQLDTLGVGVVLGMALSWLLSVFIRGF